MAKRLINNYDKVQDPGVRQRYGIISGAMGIAFNFFLFIIKLLAGVISGSISILGDAFNNLSDAASSIVTLIGFKLSGQEADAEHPFGHGRLEYVAGLIVSLLIIITGVELLQQSVNRIFHPEEVDFNYYIAVILIISIFVKLIMFQSNFSASKLIESATLKSVAIDSISDVVTTSIVFISALINFIFKLNIDGFAGILVAILIIRSGWDAARDTINPLLGEPPSKELLRDVSETVNSYDGVLGVHDITIHNYGPTRIFMSLHVEVPSDRDLISVHDMIDFIENELHQKYHCIAVIHMDPVVEGDAETDELKKKISEALIKLDSKLSFHDFRIIHRHDGRKTLKFDVVVPYDYTLSDTFIIDYLKRYSLIKDVMDCEITIDKEKRADK
ncbi:cation diffusion facilitator family transporter [Butyrivibrio proteoclasticus]|uniref:cation diffusion facilitator family transporter n=1 Tax=Butyrivibrio proteoclasticus TaxID=43305 RepID=UPI001FA89654|nr:cation diffusion facilitator family transporter [Butyrivibrio proteoclasticus]